MRSFILGLMVGGVAGYLWQSRRMRSSTLKQQVPELGLLMADSLERVAESPQVTEAVPAAAGSQPAALESGYTVRMPSYQTAPLADYRPEYQAVAEELFEKTVALIGRPAAEKSQGSYSFLTKGGSIAGRIIIYEHGRGRENGPFPMLQESVYLLLRTRRSAPNTLGIAPKEEERFHYRRVDPADLNAVAQDIADVLQADEEQWQPVRAASQQPA